MDTATLSLWQVSAWVPFQKPGATRLCALDAAQSAVWAAYEALIHEIPDDRLLSSLDERFFNQITF